MFAVLFELSAARYDTHEYLIPGALKATGNRGLQPAMDHIIEHEGRPIPDLGGVSEQASRSVPMDVDNDDEDAEALKSLGDVAGNAVEAKVKVISRTRFNSGTTTY